MTVAELIRELSELFDANAIVTRSQITITTGKSTTKLDYSKRRADASRRGV